MHGIIFSELNRFADKSFGEGTFRKLVEASGLEARVYLPVEVYPDEEIGRLVKTASDVSGIDVDTLLDRFGEFLVPRYLELYGYLVKPEWKTLDLIEHAENAIHQVVRRRTPGAAPPALVVERPSADEVIVVYSSPRRMCAVARGISRGVARHFHEKIVISEPVCMHRGAPACRISVRTSA